MVVRGSCWCRDKMYRGRRLVSRCGVGVGGMKEEVKVSEKAEVE